jgi:hypothetical protein
VPLNTVQTYLQGLLNGLTIPEQTDTLDCYITPPTLQDMNGPHAYVWGGRVSVRRQTMPRIQGFKEYPWKMSIWLVYESASTVAGEVNTTIDNEFPLVIDAVTNTLSITTMPLIIQDPDTGQYSQIQAVGESWSLQNPTVRLPETMRMLWYAALITMEVLEVVQQ